MLAPSDWLERSIQAKWPLQGDSITRSHPVALNARKVISISQIDRQQIAAGATASGSRAQRRITSLARVPVISWPACIMGPRAGSLTPSTEVVYNPFKANLLSDSARPIFRRARFWKGLRYEAEDRRNRLPLAARACQSQSLLLWASLQQPITDPNSPAGAFRHSSIEKTSGIFINS